MTKRLFVSIDLEPSLCHEVASVQTVFRDLPGISLTDPEQAHITLKFLGDVDEDAIESITETLSAALNQSGITHFPIRVEGLGVFPEFAYISVIWLGVREGGNEVAALHSAIDDPLVSLGFDPESFEFIPHVTIARMTHGEAKDSVQDVLRTTDPSVGEMLVTEICLTESTLTADGPVYDTVEAIPLDSAEG